MSEKVDPNAMPQSAEAPRMSILRKEMEKMEAERKAREAEERKLAEFTYGRDQQQRPALA